MPKTGPGQHLVRSGDPPDPFGVPAHAAYGSVGKSRSGRDCSDAGGVDQTHHPSLRPLGALDVIVGPSRAMQRVRRLVQQYAATHWIVLVHGETGTGKDLVARAIHRASPRAHHAFLAVNCAAIPESLLENELFGHVRGAFTGADRDGPGVFRAAEGGTLLLDEISELPLRLQAKLLHVLESGTYRALGSTKDVAANVRVLAATNRDLKSLTECGDFRSDLYYRLDVLRLSIPPLRERLEDIPALVERFLQRYAPDGRIRITRETLAQLMSAFWPGNVRELEHVLLRMVLSHDSGSIARIDLLADQAAGQAFVSAGSPPESGGLQSIIRAFERYTIRQVLQRHQGNKTSAARELGITYRGLLKKLQRFASASAL